MYNPIKITGLIAVAAILSACSDNSSSGEANQNMPENSAEEIVASTPDQTGALGLTAIQLDDADILNVSGVEIGEVERVITDSSGAITKLLIQIEDTDPDRFVEIPLDDLIPRMEGQDWDLETKMTREDLMALPEIK